MVVSNGDLDLDRAFAALADPTRRDIVRRAIGGDEGIAQLASHYPMTFAAIQKHVAVLERAGLVGKQRVGRRKVVRSDPDGLIAVRSLLDGYEQLWLDRVDRMSGLLADNQEAGT
jgi:DNA-binding transcriptional ArsR family regulator